MKGKILLIANLSAAAGCATRRWDKLLVELQSRGVQADHVITECSGHAISLAREASRSYDVIAAVGGDGTVNEVASGILLAGEAKTALAIIPFGTGNDAAQLLGLRSSEDAIRALVSGTTRTMDAIEIRCHEAGAELNRYALLYAAVGFAGELLKCTTPTVKWLFGPRYCYSVGFFRALLGFSSPTMRVRCDDREFRGRMFLVSAGNAEIVGAGTMRLSPGAKVDDGKLNVNVVEDLGRLETARWFPKVLKGLHTTHPKVHYFGATAVTIECEKAMEIQIDGELFGHTPATFQVRPGAIRVVSFGGARALSQEPSPPR
jgi:YegS/Rv2252/BmrU family lipid kinase